MTSRERLSAIELLASFIVDAGGGAIICVPWPPDNGEALVIFSDKRVHAGPECAVPLLGVRRPYATNWSESTRASKTFRRNMLS